MMVAVILQTNLIIRDIWKVIVHQELQQHIKKYLLKNPFVYAVVWN